MDRRPYDVVLVDDHEHLRRLVAAWLLEDDRFRLVGEAGDGPEAVDVITERQPDAVLLDIRMPTMSGNVVLQYVRRRSPRSAVVVLTADEALAGDARRAGADGVFLKPSSFDAVLDALADAVERRRRRGDQAAS